MLSNLQFISQEGKITTHTITSKKSKNTYGHYLSLIFFIVDLLLLNASYLLVAYSKPGNIITVSTKNLLFAIVYNFTWIALTFLFKRYEIGRNFSLINVFYKSIKITVTHFLIISSLIQFSGYFRLNDYYIFVNYILLLTVAPTSRIALLLALKHYRKLGYNYKKVVIVGAGEKASELYTFIKNNPDLGFKFCGFFSDERQLNDQYKGSIFDVYSYCLYNEVNEIFCVLSPIESDKIASLMTFADNNLIRIRLIPDFGIAINRKLEIGFYDNLPVLTPRHEPLERTTNRIVKRSFDILFSLFVILVIFPFVFPILGLLIKLSSRGPIFFKQLRSGKNNKCFYCYKFRTMVVNEESEKLQAVKNDYRVTKLGELLRKTNLDELPQFFNVLVGDMSVVGPRPHMLFHTEQYSKIINRYMVRHLVKPGITGWAQVNGYRGNTKDTSLMEKRIQYDMWYLENWNIWLDIKIVLMTTFNSLKGEKNAY